MDIQVTNTSWTEIEADWLVVAVFDTFSEDGPLQRLNEITDNAFQKINSADDWPAKPGKSITLYSTPDMKTPRVKLLGLGPADKLKPAGLENAMMTAARSISDKEGTSVTLAIPEWSDDLFDFEKAVAIAATAFTVGPVGQDLYSAEPSRFPFSNLEFVVSDESQHDNIRQALETGAVLGQAVNVTRELVNRPPNDIYPESFAEYARGQAEELGLECEILGQEQLEEEKMGSMLAVAQGSDQPPRLVVIKYNGAEKDSPTLAFVGKGVTFDSGGLSIKPSEGMKTMKCDMAGAATVLGALTAIAKLKLPVNIVGYMGMVENMISGSCYKLGDVLTARNGLTIENHNSDAEGRLVLADVLNYAVDQGASHLIDLATLTGACVVALGEEVTGLFTNESDWGDQVTAASKRAAERVWELPMFEDFGKLLKSNVADVKNIGSRWGGAITAAKFLEKFVDEKPWVHLDIAGPSFASSNKPFREGGATGCMVRTLVEVAREY